jgi:phasin protein
MATSNSKRAAEAASNSGPAFLDAIGWMKPLYGGPANVCGAAWSEAARLAASSLQDQADYMKKLSECTEPLEALKCHGEFVQRSWARCFEQGSRAFDALRTGTSASSA